MIRQITVLTVLLLAVLPVAADELRERLRVCLEIEDAQARLACLETAARSGPAGAGSPSSSSPANDATRSEPRPHPEAADPEPAEQTIQAVVQRTDRRPRGEWVLYLDNGQVWTELERGRAHFRPGMPVRIERAFMGSHLLTTEGGVVVRVRRLSP